METRLEQIVAELKQDEALVTKLKQIANEDVFVARTVEAAHDRGFDTVTEADVHTWMEETRRHSLSEEELDQVGGGGKGGVVVGC